MWVWIYLSGSHKKFRDSRILIEWINNLAYGYIANDEVRYCPILYNIFKYSPGLPNILEYCAILVNIGGYFLTQFWWNFIGSILGTSQTDSNYQVDICPGNICPADICPYQEYLSCHWPNFDETWKVYSKKNFDLKLLSVTCCTILAFWCFLY